MRKSRRFLAVVMAGALVLSMSSMTAFAKGRGQGRNCVNDSCIHECVNPDCSYVDEDGDGVCDNYENCERPGTGKGDRHQGNGRGNGTGRGNGRGHRGGGRGRHC